MKRIYGVLLLSLLSLGATVSVGASIVCTVQEIGNCVAFRQCCFVGPNGEEQGCWVMTKDCTQ
jgi:hypothetical protein